MKAIKTQNKARKHILAYWKTLYTTKTHSMNDKTHLKHQNTFDVAKTLQIEST